MKSSALLLLLLFILFYSGCSKANREGSLSLPVITSISPVSGRPGTTVVIKGYNFGPGLTDNIVKFNKDTAGVLQATTDSLVVNAPANGTTGPVSVTVAGQTAVGPVFTYLTDSVDIYISGVAFGVVYWKNGQQIHVASTPNNIGGAYGIAVRDTDVYVAGFTSYDIYPGKTASYWKNGKRTDLSDPNYRGEARAMFMNGNDLFVAGMEGDLPVYWKNGIKTILPSTGYARINAITVVGNDVYAAGLQPGQLNDECSVFWKNGVQTILGRQTPIDIGATAIAVNGNDVYVCATDSGDAVYWKNGQRIILQKSDGNQPVGTYAIAVHGNSVYVGGSYKGVGVYWKDGKMVSLPRKSGPAAVTSFAFYNDDVYAAGYDNSPAFWTNGIETNLCCSPGGLATSISVVKKR